MDGKTIFEGVPEGDAWIALAPDVKRHHARNVIRNALDQLTNANTEPDAWEATMLANAIGALASKMYTLAVNDVALALAPVNLRSGQARVDVIQIAVLDDLFGQAEVRSS